MTDKPCLHCQVMDVVEKHLAGDDADVEDVIWRLMEATGEVISAAPEADQRHKMTAMAVSMLVHLVDRKATRRAARKKEGAPAGVRLN
jgi:hypothetical protein